MTDDATQISSPSEPSPTLRPGDVLRGRFVIERLLGAGGMGKVFLAVDREAEQTNPFVALKMLGDAFKDHPQSLKALRREATQSRQLNHPNIVNVYDFDRTDGHVFMVMEYMQGLSLEDDLAQRGGGRPFAEAWTIIEACGEGLHYLHEHHIIHSDFKPGNVFLTHSGEIKVLDLGIARTLDETRVANGTTRFDPDAFGAMTPQYASCEMFEGLSPSAQDDLFALACVCYELLTGEHPYDRRIAIEARAMNLAPKRPRGLKSRQWKALSAALAHARGDRPPTVREFLNDMKPTRDRGSPWPWVAASVAVVVLAALVVAVEMPSADDRFEDAVLDQYADNPAVPESPDKVAEWLRQGAFFLDLGRRSMAAGEYNRGLSQLLTGPSSAYQSYHLVLTRSGLQDAKSQAAAGLLGISHVLRDTAAKMMERHEDLSSVASMTCHGLWVNRFEPELERLLKTANDRIPKGVGSVTDCRELIDSGRVSL